MELSPGKLWGLRRLADEHGRFKMTAVDQRPPIERLVAERRRSANAPYEDVARVKSLLVEELAASSSAILLDPRYAYPGALRHVRPNQGLILTLEDSNFDETARGRRSSAIDGWSVAKIKRTGADAVKVLAWYRPDADPAVCAHQQDFVAEVGEQCRRFDIPFVFELLVYSFPTEAGHTTAYVEQPGKRTEHILESVETFAAPRFGVDLFKLESPVGGSEIPDREDDAVQAAFDELGRLAGRPWVMLSAGAGKDMFRRILTYAYRAGASGYLAGRSIWWDAFQAFPDLVRMREELRVDGVPFMTDLNRLTDSLAVPWMDHAVFSGSVQPAGTGPGFPRAYDDFGLSG